MKAGQEIALLGSEESIRLLASEFKLISEPPLKRFSRLRDPDESGLIPLGIAMQKTGASMFLAEKIMVMVSGRHPLFLILTVGIISTIFSLLVSNFAAIVVLAPMIIGMAEIGGLDPRPLVLMAAVCVSNSFILPTQQVNALLMTPGGYRNADFIKGGGGLTILFLLITVSFFYFILI
ncbi:MAG: hypothetical protein RQ761_12835 [Bacteroidales bacterium]|nr:hypothetical protein [Bacteroidales bacterium]